ncbi:MAG: MarR family transcriptional regulator [Bacteroidota bacterium]
MKNCDTKYCECMYYSANALARVMTKIADEEFSNIGVSASYAFLLMIVNENPGINPKKIGNIMQLAPSTITRLIEKMEFKGYLIRDQNWRSTKVFPKQASLDLDKKIRRSWENLNLRYTSILGTKEAEQLTSKMHIASQILSN